MESLFIYLLKSVALMATFLLAYHIFLRNETFFRSNRGYLVGGLITSALLPLVTFEKIVWVEPQIYSTANDAVYYAETSIPPAPFNYELIFTAIYLAGVGICAFKLIFDLVALRKVLHGRKVSQQGRFGFVDVSDNVAPFSWFNTIVYNSSLYSVAELHNILEHEKIHSRQLHSLDVLLAQIFCTLFWFSPFVWLYKKAMLQNLEFIADCEATKRVDDSKSYQMTLLKITAQKNCISITNHFFQSLIKKRIVMLNKNQSKRKNSWKYALVIPALVAFMFYFQVDVIAQEKTITNEDGSTVSASSRKIIEMTWTKNSSDQEFKNDAALMKKSGVDFKFSNIKRNAQGEITGIKISYKDDQGNQSTKQVSGKYPIEPIHFMRKVDMNGKGQIGFYVSSKADMPKIPQVPATPKLNALLESTNERSRVIVRSTDEKPVIIVDGDVVASDFDMNSIDPENIETMYVYSDKKEDGNGNGVIRIDTKTITKEARAKAEEAMNRAKQVLKEAEIEMQQAAPEMERAKAAMTKAYPEMERAKLAQENAKVQMEQAKKEIEQAREEIRKAKLEIEQARAEMQKEREASKK